MANGVFAILNPTVTALLRSPLRGILARHVLVIRFTGRKSGRTLSTPVRYVREGDRLMCLTGHEMRWWHNFKQPAPVQLLLNGRWQAATAQAVWQGEAAVSEAMVTLFTRYPQDAKLYGVRLNADGQPNKADIKTATPGAVLVVFRLD
ncbi:MAG TPA: nitroreductase/quinone reductase family protein [Pseudomonadales bacterium]|jgi:deazaflavin-dependent oxidoreductase (nitroreductase family)